MPLHFRLCHPLPEFPAMGQPDNDFLVYLPVYDMWDEQDGRLLLSIFIRWQSVLPVYRGGASYL